MTIAHLLSSGRVAAVVFVVLVLIVAVILLAENDSRRDCRDVANAYGHTAESYLCGPPLW